MSAGSNSSALRVHNDVAELAPLFRAAVARAIAQCAERGLDAFVYEAYRTPELQSEYFSRGRTKYSDCSSRSISRAGAPNAHHTLPLPTHPTTCSAGMATDWQST